ncbi:LysR family transcriptional regulator [Microbacterium soli]|uniref:LysR substrate-binding domain-containing protein n=1 Tax=Microbacterium soli TaxID=446075 RepID=A0ABP7NL40_9MICO
MSDPYLTLADLSLRDVQAFIAVASTGSFRSAAGQLFTSQPAISRSVARLEADLGVRLLERGPRGATVTPAGEAALHRARVLASEVVALRTEARNGSRATIRLGAAATAAGSYLAPFLARWIPSNTTVRLQVIENGSARLRHQLIAGECDIAIVAPPIPPQFHSLPIARVGIRAYFPEGHELDVDDGPVSITDLAKFDLLVNDPSFLSTQELTASFEAAGLHPQVVYESSNAHTLAALAEAGVGVAVFASTVDVRGIPLASRAIRDRAWNSLGFSLRVAWSAGPRTPSYIREFGRLISEFSQQAAEGTAPPRGQDSNRGSGDDT